MLRRLLILGILLLSLGSLPRTVFGQSVVEQVVGDIDTFWSGEFANYGLAYSSPGLQAVDSPVDTECGVLDPTWSPGAYCAANDTIYISLAWSPESAGPDILWWTVLSHEWGHHIQHLVDTGVTDIRSAELQADCFAGAYMTHAQDWGLVSPSAVSEALSLTQSAGDVWFFLPEGAPEHGNKAERALAFMTGMNGGISACGFGS